MSRFGRNIALVVLIMALGLRAVFAQESSTPTVTTARVVASEVSVPLLSGPTDHASVIRQVPNDTEVTILGATADQNWYHVRLSNNRTGWISADFLEFQTAYATPMPSINDQVLRLGDLASMHTNRQEYNEALELYTQAIELDSTNVEVYEGRGYIYSLQGEYEKALDDLNHAVENGSHNPYLFVLRSTVYQYMGQYDHALDDLNHALELSPKDDTVYLIRGLLYLTMGNYDFAVGDLNEVIRHDTTNAQAYFARGMTYFYKNQYSEALADFNHGVELTPDDSNIYAWRGSTYAAMGGSDEEVRADYCRHIRLAGENAYPNVTDEIAQHGWQCSNST